MGSIDTKAIMNQVTTLATSTVSNYSQQAIQDGGALLTSSAAKLQEYADQLAAKEIAEDDLDDLKLDLQDLAEMDQLKATAIGQQQLAEYTNSVIGILIKAVISAAIP